MSDLQKDNMTNFIINKTGRESGIDKSKIKNMIRQASHFISGTQSIDINRFAQTISDSATKETVDNRFFKLAQETNKLKDANRYTKQAAEDVTGEDDNELINLNRYIDNL